jgi:tRNA nucleotidyltransferase (CCA-adding enzyme)
MLEHPAAPIAEELANRHRAKLTSHPRFFTFRLELPSGRHLDIVTARRETYPGNAALPVIEANSSIKIADDLKRRDFSVNAVACWLNQDRLGQILDPFYGRADMNAKQIRILHDGSFRDDPTRLFRAARFAGRFGFSIEKKTLQAAEVALKENWPNRLSPVRRRHELEMILRERRPLPALDLCEKWGLLRTLDPDWKILPEHQESLKEETSPNPTKRLAAWLAPWGAERAQKTMSALMFEKSTKRAVLGLL